MSATSLLVKVSADTVGFKDGLRQLLSDLTGVNQSLELLKKIAEPLKDAAIECIKLGMEVEEVGRRFDYVFGDKAEQMIDVFERLTVIVPEGVDEMQQMSFRTKEFAENLGLAGDQASLMAQGLVQMAAVEHSAKMVDMASAMDTLERGLSRGVLKFNDLGLVLKKEQVEMEAFRLGIIKSKDELDGARTAIAAYSLLQKQVSKDTGAMGLASQNAAEQWRLFKRDIEDLGEAIGTFFLPLIHMTIQFMRILLNIITNFSWDKFADFIAAIASFMSGDFAGGMGLWTKLWADLNKADVPEMPKVDDLIGGLGDVEGKLSPLEQLKKDAKSIMDAFKLTKEMGGDMRASTAAIIDLNERVLRLYSAQADKMSETALEAQRLARELSVIVALRNVVGANAALMATGGFDGRKQYIQENINAASHAQMSPLDMRYRLAGEQVSDENGLRMREAKLQMVDMFDGVRMAALEMKEEFRRTSNELSKSVAAFKANWSNAGQSAMSGLESGISGILMAFTPFMLVIKAVGAVMQGLQPFIDALFVPFMELGEMIGIYLTPLFRIMFNVLKPVIQSMGLIMEIISRIVGGIATGIGKLLVGLGNLINKLPGSPGNPIKHAGEGILKFAEDMYKSADDLKRARKELGSLTFEQAKDGIKDLGDAARDTAEALQNLPEMFKINLAKYHASEYTNVPTGVVVTGGGGNTQQLPGSNSGAAIPENSGVALNINLDGRTIAQVTWDHLRAAANAQLGDPRRTPEVVAI